MRAEFTNRNVDAEQQLSMADIVAQVNKRAPEWRSASAKSEPKESKVCKQLTEALSPSSSSTDAISREQASSSRTEQIAETSPNDSPLISKGITQNTTFSNESRILKGYSTDPFDTNVLAVLPPMPSYGSPIKTTAVSVVAVEQVTTSPRSSYQQLPPNYQQQENYQQHPNYQRHHPYHQELLSHQRQLFISHEMGRQFHQDHQRFYEQQYRPMLFPRGLPPYQMPLWPPPVPSSTPLPQRPPAIPGVGQEGETETEDWPVSA